MKSWLKDPEIQEYLRINRYEGVLWFNKESFDHLTRGLLTVAIIRLKANADLTSAQVSAKVSDCYKIIHRIRKASKKSGYQVGKLLEELKRK